MTISSAMVHALYLPECEIAIDAPEQRESLVAPLKALRYVRRQDREGGGEFYVSTFGAVVLVQCFGNYPSPTEAERAYHDGFATSFSRARNWATRIVGREVPIGFSFLWTKEPTPSISWGHVRLGDSDEERMVLIEAVLIFCLARAFEYGVSRLPENRARGRVNNAVLEQAQDLAAAREPAGFLTSAEEVALMEEFYASWRLRPLIDSQLARFERATSSLSLRWELAERRRDTIGGMLLAVVAVAGLLQADAQLARVLGVQATDVDKALVVVAALLLGVVSWRVIVWRWLARRDSRDERRRLVDAASKDDHTA